MNKLFLLSRLKFYSIIILGSLVICYFSLFIRDIYIGGPDLASYRGVIRGSLISSLIVFIVFIIDSILIVKYERRKRQSKVQSNEAENQKISSIRKKSFFLLSRLKFYPLIFLIGAGLLVAFFFLLRSAASDCQGMGCLAIAPVFGFLAVIIYAFFLILSVILSVVYEIKMTPERNKHKILIPLYFILYVSIIFWPFLIERISIKVNEIHEARQEIKAQDYQEIMQSFLDENDYEGCAKYFLGKEKYISWEGATYVVDCEGRFALLRKDISLCPDNNSTCSLPVIKKIKEEQKLLNQIDKKYITSLCFSKKVNLAYRTACVQNYVCDLYDDGKTGYNPADCQVEDPTTAISCQDSDGGKNLLEKGIISIVYNTGDKGAQKDSCNDDGTLREWYCGKEGETGGLLMAINFANCTDGLICKDGACVINNGGTNASDNAPGNQESYVDKVNNSPEPVALVNPVDSIDPLSITACTDSDGGASYYELGGVRVPWSGGKGYGSNDCCKQDGQDMCVEESGYLYESICENDIATRVIYKCPIGCQNGVCIK